MAVKVSNAVALAMVNAAVDLPDVGSGTAKIEIRSGTKPAGPETAPPDGNILASFDLPNPAFGPASDQNPGARASLLGVPLSDTSANNTGTPTWFRLYDRNGTALLDGTIGEEMTLDVPTITQGQKVSIVSLHIDHGE